MSKEADALAVQIKLAAAGARNGEVHPAIGDLMSIAHDFGFLHANGTLSSSEVEAISSMLNEALYSSIYPNIR